MSLLDPWIWLGVFILLAYTIEAITGFGSIVIRHRYYQYHVSACHIL